MIKWIISCFWLISVSVMAADEIEIISLDATAQGIMAGEMLPDWQWQTPDNQFIALQDMRGQAVVVVYWASWCPFCKNLFKGLHTFAEKYHQQGLRILAINVWDTVDPVVFMKEFDYNFIVINEGEASAEAYGVFGTPTVFVLNPSGKVIYRTSNSNPHNPELKRAILDSLNLMSSP